MYNNNMYTVTVNTFNVIVINTITNKRTLNEVTVRINITRYHL